MLQCMIIVLLLLHVAVAYNSFNAPIHRSGLFSQSPTNVLLHKSLSSRSTIIQLSAKTAKADTEAAVSEIDVGYQNDVKRTLGWVGAAAAFATGIAAMNGYEQSIEFCSGYLLEQCLSVDNLFVILVIFEYFGIERDSQDKALQYGIIGAIVLRGLFIGLGSVAIGSFKQVLLVFAGILLVSSYKVLFSDEEDEEEDLADSPLIKFASKYLKTTDTMDGDNFFTIVNGVKMATPYLLCVICIELSDIVFAFDSVPAIFGVTENPFIVFTSNIFAIAGLRSLFGVLSRAVTDLQYLEKSVGIILGIIALKLGFETVDIELLDPLQSLAVVISVLGAGVGLSLLSSPSENEVDLE